MILVDFFDNDLRNTLVPIKTMKPEKVYFLLDNTKEEDPCIRSMAEAVYAWGDVREIYYYPVNVSDYGDINERLAEIFDSISGCEVFMEFSGGNELMIAAGYELCRKGMAMPLFMDKKNNKMVNASTGESICNLCHITLEDYLCAIGAECVEHSRYVPSQKEEDCVEKMAQVVGANTGQWHAIQDYVSKRTMADSWYQNFRVPEKITYNSKVYNTDFLMKKFVEYGFVERIQGTVYRFLDAKYYHYMTVYGVWLEMYVYLSAKKYFDEVYQGVCIEWNREMGGDNQDNEIDVLVMKDSMPIIISCKMKKPGNYDVYEVGYLATRLGGENARSIMATTYEITKEDPWGSGIYGRLNKMNVGLIEVKNLAQKPQKKVWDKVLKYIH